MDRMMLTFSDLRRFVISTFEQGHRLKAPGLTFSHGNIGNEYVELAEQADHFVSSLEPHDMLILVKQEFLEEMEERIDKAVASLREVMQEVSEMEKMQASWSPTDEIGEPQSINISYATARKILFCLNGQPRKATAADALKAVLDPKLYDRLRAEQVANAVKEPIPGFRH